MTIEQATSLTAHLLSLCFLIYGVELFLLSRHSSFQRIWSLENLRSDFETALPVHPNFIPVLFSVKSFQVIAILQMSLAIFSYFHPAPYFFLVLFILHLLVCVRFRGTFNGGSDMMSFVVLTGLLITKLGSPDSGFKLGLIYISIHTLYSYFKAGIVKLKEREWRTGQALPEFLYRSLFPEIQSLAVWLQHRKALSWGLCWIVMIFELLSPALLFFPRFSWAYFYLALLFHFSVLVTFGLNRFFWIWLAAWPSVLYTVNLLTSV